MWNNNLLYSYLLPFCHEAHRMFVKRKFITRDIDPAQHESLGSCISRLKAENIIVTTQYIQSSDWKRV